MSVWRPPQPTILPVLHPYPALFAIIPRIWTRSRMRVRQTHQRQIRDGRQSGSTLTPECWLERNQNDWQLLLLTQHEGQFSHLLPPHATKPATEIHLLHVLFFADSPVPQIPLSPINLLSEQGKKKVDVYLLYILMIALWCKMCRKYPLLSFKHWRVCLCIVSLESLCLVIFTLLPCILFKMSVDVGLRICLLKLIDVTILPKPIFLFKEILFLFFIFFVANMFKKYGFYCDDLFVARQSSVGSYVLFDPVCSWRLSCSALWAVWTKQPDCCCLLVKRSQMLS